ncbi:BrxA/BrxB family bacilliredoxin [Ammoniphilus oxalaticus]
MMPFDAYMNQLKQMVQPMRDELTQAGFQELTTPEEVDNFFKDTKGVTVMVINSVCGCAAGIARPAVIYSVKESEKKPDHFVTVFAGQDKEATAQARTYIDGIPPSSPSIALFKDGEIVHFIPREQIEGQTAESVVANLQQAYNKYCD